MTDKLTQAVKLSNWIVDHLDKLTPEEIRRYREEITRLRDEWKREQEENPLAGWKRPRQV